MATNEEYIEQVSGVRYKLKADDIIEKYGQSPGKAKQK